MELTITEFASRKTAEGKLSKVSWSDLVDRLKEPVITLETNSDYQSMTNEERTDTKDVGGFVGGEFKDNRRSKANLLNRTLLAIDADSATLNDIADFKRNPCTGMPLYFCHTTHTSTSLNLRLRWLFPLARPVTAYEYTRLARVVSGWVGSGSVDETTDQPERLMFWPSVSLDGEYQTWQGGIEPIDPDRWLDEELEEEPEVEYTQAPTSSGAEVLEGSRNVSLHKYGVSLTANGIEGQELLRLMRVWNTDNCIPPLPEREVIRTYQSVQATGIRPVTIAQDFVDIGGFAKREDTPLPVKEVEHMHVFSMADLLARDINPPEFVVEDLITVGLTIIASPPKYGKSWLSMDMCCSIASGAEFLGMKTKQSDVLYLALEDGEYRLQKRYRKVNGNRPSEHNFHYSLKAKGLNEGLLSELEFQLNSCPNLRLIIIDTLQKVRGTAKKTEGVYGYDYRELGALQEFAVSRGVALILIHHLNKGGDDSDFVSRLNGSTGLSGAADCIITMTRANRGDDLTKMSIVGRDVMERTLMLRMDWSKYRWECLGDERDFHESEEEREYHTSGLIKGIQYKMDELEDFLIQSGENHEEVFWKTDSVSLREYVNTSHNAEIANTTVLRNKLESYKPLLLNLAGIRYSYDGETRSHTFRRAIS